MKRGWNPGYTGIMGKDTWVRGVIKGENLYGK
jgi:hypothetical protein